MTTQATSDAQDTTKATDTTTTSATADTKTADTKAATTDASTTTDKAKADTKADDKADTSKTGDKGENKADTKDAKADTKDDDKPKAPEKYDLKLSENSLLEPSVIDEVAAIAREQGLSNEQAQERIGQIEKQAEERREANIKAWEKAVLADKEIGGDNFKTTHANVARFAAKFAPKDSPIAALLHRTGFGSHPAVVRLMNDIGKAMAEDKPLGSTGGTGSGGRKGPESLYDHPSNNGAT